MSTPATDADQPQSRQSKTPDAPPPSQWRRVHWSTPIVNGAGTFTVIFTIIGYNWASDWLEGSDYSIHLSSWIPLALVSAVILVVGIYSYIAWRFIGYAIDADSVHFQHGIIFRNRRYVRLTRLQAVDIIHPLLGRFFGVCALDVQTAGGHDSRVKIFYLTSDEATVLRNEILARAAGIKARNRTQARQAADAPHGDTASQVVATDSAHAAGQVVAADNADAAALPAFDEAPERVFFTLPTSRLLGSIALSMPTIAGVLVLTWLLIALPFTGSQGIIGVLPVLAVLASWLWVTGAGTFNFTLALSPDGFRTRHGLTETRAQTIPPRRIQAISIRQPLLWRWKDWWKVEIDVAGYGEGSDSENTSTAGSRNTLLPVGTRAEAETVLWLVLPNLGVDNPQETFRNLLVGSGPAPGFICAPARTRVFDWLTWRRRALCITDTALLIRDGFLRRRAAIVPHERTQSLALSQGPIDRHFLHTAHLEAHSVSGPVQTVAYHLPEHEAARIIWDQAERARRARHDEGPEEWMVRAGQVT